MRIGVIGGTSLTRIAESTEPIDVETPYGDVVLHYAKSGGHEWVFLMRHGEASAHTVRESAASPQGRGLRHALPPHRIPYRANAWAMRAARADRVLAVASVGSLRPEIGPGTFVVPDDFIDFSGRTERTFFDDDVVHVEVTEAYCPEVRAALVAGAQEAGAPTVDGGVYASTPGPRFETRAEVRFLAAHAHVVGMTGCPEAALMRELGHCYGNVSVVGNYAAGIGERAFLVDHILETARATEPLVRDALARAAAALPAQKACGCARAVEGARIR